MAVFLLLLLAIPGGLSCNAPTMPKNRAKIIEEYVVSAKFDDNKNIPQLNAKNQFREVREDNSNGRPDPKGASVHFPITSRGNHRDGEHLSDDFHVVDTLEERDLLVPHHHHPPPLPPPPPVGLPYAPSLFAVGLITFLILLNSLQTSLLLILKSKGSALGSVTGALGRRKRFARADVHKFEIKYRDMN